MFKAKLVFCLISLSAVVLFNGVIYADIEEGLVAFYPFEGNAVDVSGHDYHGQENGNIQYSEGVIGQSALLDGNGSFIKIENNDDFQLTTWSITGWVKVNRLSKNPSAIIAKNSFTDKYNFFIVVDKNQQIRSQYEICNSENDRTIYSNKINTNEWLFFSSLRDNSTGKHSIYINGQEHSSKIWKDTPCVSGSSELRIGHFCAKDGCLSFFNGYIDNIRIYNRILSDHEIQQLYNEAEALQGCISYKNRAIEDGKAMLMQSGEIFQTTPLDANGCYKFFNVNDQKSFSVVIRKNSD